MDNKHDSTEPIKSDKIDSIKPNIQPGSFIPGDGITLPQVPENNKVKLGEQIKNVQATMNRHQRRTFKALMRREARKALRKQRRTN